MRKARIAVIFTVLALGFSSLAEAQRKYLVLGADPQQANRQPIPGVEEVVILDHDICDKGWGTGSGKKVRGCYPKHSAAIREIATGNLTAMFVCGNDPSGKHRVTGKVVESVSLAALALQQKLDAAMLGLKKEKGDSGPPGQPGPRGNPGKDAHVNMWKVAGIAAIVAAIVAAGIELLGGDDKPKEEGRPPDGNTGPAFHRGLSFSVGEIFH